MESGHRFDAQTLHSFIQAVFRQMGSEEQEAKLVADHLIAANLAGHDSHGIGMIPSYVRSLGVRGTCKLTIMPKSLKRRGGGGHARWRSRIWSGRGTRSDGAGGLRKRISTVLLPWRYITRIISAVSVTGQNSAQRRGLSLSTLLAWSVVSNGRAVPRSRQPLWHQSVLCGFPT